MFSSHNFELGVSNFFGGIAQLGERLVCNQVVSGSNPLTSTRLKCARKR